MKINYKALWIDDHLDMIQPQIQGISDKLEDYGFIFEVDERSSLSGDELEELSNRLSLYNPYDMIIFDYDLGKEMKPGNEIARDLRTTLYTDMIFYSGKAPEKLRQALFDSGVEGVFTVDRSKFVEETWPIVEDQIRRICDINNMRGVLLDEMSKIDLKLRELYHEKYKALASEEQKTQVIKLKQRITRRHSTVKKLEASIDSESLPEIMLNPIKTDFEIVRTRLKSFFKGHEFFNDKSELVLKQKLRNKFAHNKAIYNEDKGTVSLNGYEEEEYSFEKFKNIRMDLISILDELEEISS